MKITPLKLSKTEIEKIIDNTDAIFNIITHSRSGITFRGSAYENFLLNHSVKLRITRNLPQYKINKRISQVMGFKEQFHARYGSENYDNAVWGVKIDNNPNYLLFVFNSRKGIEVQAYPEMPANVIIKFLQWFMR